MEKPTALTTRKLPTGSIEASLGGLTVIVREKDGYINATRLCKDGGKRFNNWHQLDSASAFLTSLSTETGIPASDLVCISKGGDPTEQGTWVHPDVAVQLANWISPEFAVKVSQVVRRYYAGDLTLAKEVVANHDQVHGTTSTVTVNTVLGKRSHAQMTDAELWVSDARYRQREMAKSVDLTYNLLAKLGGLDAATEACLRDLSKNTLLQLTDDTGSVSSPVTWGVVMRAQYLGYRVRREDWSVLGISAVREYRKHYGHDPTCGKKAAFAGDSGCTVWHYSEQECKAVVDAVIRKHFKM